MISDHDLGSNTCTSQEIQGVRDAASDEPLQCDLSFLPEKCSSLLNGVDINKGLVLGKQNSKKGKGATDLDSHFLRGF